MDGKKEVNIYGQKVSVEAEVAIMSSLSAHADYSEILEWLTHLKKAPKKVFLIHGEVDSSLALKSKIEHKFHWQCIIPKYLHSEDL